MPRETLVLLFVVSNLLPAPFYALMIFAPRASLTRRVIGSLWSVAPLVLMHVVTATVIGLSEPALLVALGDIIANGVSMAGFEALLAAIQNPAGVIAMWVHMIAADFVMARWAYLDSRAQRLNPWWVGPTLLLMYASGGIGLAAYLVGRALAARQK